VLCRSIMTQRARAFVLSNHASQNFKFQPPFKPSIPARIRKSVHASLRVNTVCTRTRIRYDLSSSHHPSRQTFYSPSHPSLRYHRDGPFLCDDDRINNGSTAKHTVQANICTVFQRFGEVKPIFMQPDGMCADVVFADVHLCLYLACVC